MGKDRKYALLDTDFLYKTHLARNDSNTLADLVMGFEEYEYFCHEVVTEELTRREINPNPYPWLNERIAEGRIKLFTDQAILNELQRIYGELATTVYMDLLKNSCEAFNAGFYDKYYGMLEHIESVNDVDGFLAILKRCDECIPYQNGVGEKKSLVLLQLLEVLYGNEVYVFCSDDFKARQSIAALFNPVSCISVLGVFYKLRKLGYDKAVMKEYYDCLTVSLKNQTDFKVWSDTGYQRVKVPISKVFDDLYDDKFLMLRNGDLRYKKGY